jgi:hypothetical protein
MQKFVQMLVMLVLVFAVAFGAGCATITNKDGTAQKVQVNSNPQGAKVKIDGQFMGETPTAVLLARGEHHQIELGLTGYAPVQYSTTRSCNWLTMLNILNYGVGIPVDWWDGAIYNIDPVPTFTLQGEVVKAKVQPKTATKKPAIKKPVQKPKVVPTNP